MRVCVTGTGGFVGSALLGALVSRGCEVVAIERCSRKAVNRRRPVERVQWNLEQSPPSPEYLGKLDAAVHLAGRAHVLHEKSSEPLVDFRRANVEATRNITQAAIAAGARRFVFTSTIAVHGRALTDAEPVTEAAPVAPLEPYAISKWEAEEYLRGVAMQGAFDLTVLRPTLVAGWGAPGNLARLGRLVKLGAPMPVPFRDNARSLVGLKSLIELIVQSLEHPGASGESFVVADPMWPSTRQAVQWIAEGMGRPFRRLVVPTSLMRASARGLGKASVYDKVFGDLRVDSSKARVQLGWQPVEPLAQALRDVGRALRA